MTMILLICLVLFCSVLSLIDFSIYRQRITPFTMLALPFTAVLTLAVLFAEPLGFVAVDPGIITLWMLGLGAFWVGGLPFAITSHKKRHAIVSHTGKAANERKVIRCAKVFGWSSLLVSGLAILAAMANSGVSAIGTSEFGKIFSSGIAGHSIVVGSSVLILLIGTADKQQPKSILLILLLIAVSLLYSVRSWVLIPIIAGVIYRVLTRRLKITAIMVVTIILVGFIVFFFEIHPKLVFDRPLHIAKRRKSAISDSALPRLYLRGYFGWQ